MTRRAEPGFGDALGGVVVLGVGDGGGRHPAAVVGRGVDGEAAPAGADLDDVIVGAELQPLTDAVELGG